MKQPVLCGSEGQLRANLLPVFVTAELEIQGGMVTFSAGNQEQQRHYFVPQADVNFRLLERSAESLYLIKFKRIHCFLPHFFSHALDLFVERFTASILAIF
jgi:hypothetical protein